MFDPEIVNLVLEQLDTVIDLLKLPETDVVWSNYDSAEEAIYDLNSARSLLLEGNKEIIEHIKLLFASTSDMQEISISSGWRNEYLEISSNLDCYLEKLKRLL